jgi:hypothetical protein
MPTPYVHRRRDTRAQTDQASVIACAFVVLSVLGFVAWSIADRVAQHGAPTAVSDITSPVTSQAGARL